MRVFLGLMLLAAGFFATAAPALAERKIALVIGNDAYTDVTPLKRAAADARSYKDMLATQRGFEVIFAENADRATMVGKVGEFLGHIRQGDVAMVVYSGHGVQLDPNRGDTLYLLPTDIPAVDPGAGGASFFMDANAINFTRLSSEVEARGAALRLFVLDACRNNPFPALEGGRSIGLTRGLGNIRSSRGEFVFFAAAPGEVALDLLPGDDASTNSVFTRVFLKHFRQGAFLEDVANDVQAEVLELSRQAAIIQEPYYTDGVAGKTCIDRECGTAQATPGGGSDLEATYWRLCETRDTLSYCRAYLDTFPQGPHAPLAELRIAELEDAVAADSGEASPRVVTIGPVTETATPPTSQPEAATPEAAAEAPPGPSPEPRVAAVEPAAPVPSHTERSGAEEARLARQREVYLAWTQLEGSWDIRAIRAFRDRYPDAEQVPEADRRISFLRARHAEAQAELNRLGYDAGPVDGAWGRRSAAALEAFQGDQGLPRGGDVDPEVLYALKTASPRVAAATAPEQAPRRKAESTARSDPATAVQPEARVAALPPVTSGIGDGETWRATASTPNGTALVATMTRQGGKLRLDVDFDHRDNLGYYAWLIDRYTKSCTEPASKSEFDCWFSGDVAQNRPSSPGARVRGGFPRLRFEAHNIIGAVELVFKPVR
jgi:hypothetical protein